jgi:hypothetical protein
MAGVKMANGTILHTSVELLQAEWFLQDYAFQSDLKVLQLHSFDMVLGMEWLERFSPMRIHWAHKWLTIPYQGTSITLQGIVPGSLDCAMVELMHLTSEAPHSSPEEVPVVIQQLLQ